MNESNSLSKKRHKKRKVSMFSIMYYLIFCIITVIVITPMLITVFAAFKTNAQLGSDFPLKPPTKLYLNNFVTVFKKGHVLLGLKNTIIIVTISLVVNTLISTMVAYCLTRFDFKFKKLVLFAFMLGMIIPAFVTEIARFGIIKNIGLYNTIFAPIIIYAGADLMQLYIYIQYMNQIPKSLDESAMIDGCTYFQVYWKIIFPIIIPAAFTLAILKAVTIMNDMYIPYLYMPSSKLRTLTTTLMAFSNARTGSTTNLSAAIIIIMIPSLAVFLYFQKFIFKGIVHGAVKE